VGTNSFLEGVLSGCAVRRKIRRNGRLRHRGERGPGRANHWDAIAADACRRMAFRSNSARDGCWKPAR